MQKPDFFLNNKLTNKQYFNPNNFTSGSQPQQIENSYALLNHTNNSLQKPLTSSKFKYFMEKTFYKPSISTNSLIKPIHISQPNDFFLPRRHSNETVPLNSFRLKSQDGKSQSKQKTQTFSKNLTISCINNQNNTTEELKAKKLKDISFFRHLKELKNRNTTKGFLKKFSKELEVEKKKEKANEITKKQPFEIGNNSKFKKRMNILKFINSLKLTSQTNENYKESIELTRFEYKRLKSLKEKLNDIIDKFYQNIDILLVNSGHNSKNIAKVLKKINGYHDDIGKFIFDVKKHEIKPDFSKEKLRDNIKILITASTGSYLLWFIEKMVYFNENVLSYILKKDKEWFEVKTQEIKNDLDIWREKKRDYLKSIKTKKNNYFLKEKIIETASEFFQPKNYIMNKLLWENLEKNERIMGDYPNLGLYQREQWRHIQTLEDNLK